MSGALTQFAPTNAAPFQFNATLDGDVYACYVTWNLWAQRWYLNIYDTTGNLIVARALIASPPGYPINLVFGYFTSSTLVFWDGTQAFQVVP